MKKVLIVTTVGGFLTQFEKNNVEILQEYGYEVHYASNFNYPVYSIDKEWMKEKQIYRHPLMMRKNPFAIGTHIKVYRQLKQIIDEQEIDLIHCHTPVGGALARWAAHKSRRNPYVIYTAHGFHFYQGAPVYYWLLYYSVERVLAHMTDQLVTINQEDYKRGRRFHFRKNEGAKQTELFPVAKIPGVGLNVRKYRRQPNQCNPMRQKLGVPVDCFHIVSVGELNENKNHRTLIQAIEQLGRSDIYCSICGKGPNEDELRRQIKDAGLSRQVRLLGYRNDIEEVLQSADCFVFPSIREGLGMAALEAMACRLPVIAADNRGTREYILDGSNGITCQTKSPESFAKAILYLLEHKDQCFDMGKRAEETAGRFSINETEKVMREVYNQADCIIQKHKGENYA